MKIRDSDAMAARGQAHVLIVGQTSAKDKTKRSYQSGTAARMNCRICAMSALLYHRKIVGFDLLSFERLIHRLES